MFWFCHLVSNKIRRTPWMWHLCSITIWRRIWALLILNIYPSRIYSLEKLIKGLSMENKYLRVGKITRISRMRLSLIWCRYILKSVRGRIRGGYLKDFQGQGCRLWHFKIWKLYLIRFLCLIWLIKFLWIDLIKNYSWGLVLSFKLLKKWDRFLKMLSQNIKWTYKE